MLGWFQALMPREHKFFDLYKAHADTLVVGAEALAELLKGGPGMADAALHLEVKESEADEITRQVMNAVRRTFITPFDRGDIKDLISLLDDAIDQMHKTAKVSMLFEVKAFDAPMQEMGGIIVQAARLTRKVVELMPDMRQNVHLIHDVTEEIITLEEHSDRIYDEGRKALFLKNRTTDPMAFIVGVEIYSHLEKVVDRFEDVANRISGIVIEQV